MCVWRETVFVWRVMVCVSRVTVCVRNKACDDILGVFIQDEKIWCQLSKGSAIKRSMRQMPAPVCSK